MSFVLVANCPWLANVKVCSGVYQTMLGAKQALQLLSKAVKLRYGCLGEATTIQLHVTPIAPDLWIQQQVCYLIWTPHIS